MTENTETSPRGPLEHFVRRCKVCGAEMRLRKEGKRTPRYRCQPCHTKAVREKDAASTRKAATKFRKTKPERYAQNRKNAAIKNCGVASGTSARSKKSEKHASNARQRWTTKNDDLVLSRKHTESQLAKLLGRSIRAIQRRRHRLRQPMTHNAALSGPQHVTPEGEKTSPCGSDLNDELGATAMTAELAVLRARVKAQRAELRRLNKVLGPYWRIWKKGADHSEAVCLRGKMIATFGSDAVRIAERGK